MILKCIVIDDEPLAAELISGYVRKTPFLHLAGTYNSAITAMKQLRESPADLIFLDIQMPELNGIEFAKILPKETRVVFITAFNRYAIDGYEVNALGYMLKPASYADFLKTANKGLEFFTMIKENSRHADDRFIYVKSEYKLLRICLDDILYIEGLKDYVQIYLENGEKIMSLISMKMLSDYLPAPEFMRTHRSYIVHMSKIKMIDRLRIIFGSTYIPISESYKNEVIAYLDSHTLA